MIAKRGGALTVVFDLGNVLIAWDPRGLYRKLFPDDAERMEWFLANVCTTAWNETHDAGRAFADGIAELIPRFPEYAPHIRAFYERWDEMLPGAIEGSVSILRELHRGGTQLYALSNWSRET